MSNALALTAIVIVSFLVGLGFLVWMVRRYYWGPTGLPPSRRYGRTDSHRIEGKQASAGKEDQ